MAEEEILGAAHKLNTLLATSSDTHRVSIRQTNRLIIAGYAEKHSNHKIHCVGKIRRFFMTDQATHTNTTVLPTFCSKNATRIEPPSLSIQHHLQDAAT
jgi:hypothetical protein